MHRYGFLVLILCYNVLCIKDECVTYNFEDTKKANFTNTYGICQGFCSWNVGNYSSLIIDSPHRDSSIFISPRPTLSCISSFKFKVTAGGILELNVFMAPSERTDQITILVFKSLTHSHDSVVGSDVLSVNNHNFKPGWHTMRVNIVGIGTHEGYITLLGMASESSSVLVDSFRYIAPTYDESSCLIYPDEKLSTEIPIEISTIPVTEYTETPTAKTNTILYESTTVSHESTSIGEETSISPEEPSTIPDELTTIPEKPSIVPSKPTTIFDSLTTVPEKPTTILESPTTVPERPTTILESTTTVPEKSTTEPAKPTTTPERPTTVPAKPTTIPDKPSTITIPTIGSTSSTEKSTNIYETSTKVTTSSSTTVATSTQRPRLSISILLIKIKKFFR